MRIKFPEVVIHKHNDRIVSITIDGEEWANRTTEASVSTRNENLTEVSITFPCSRVEIVDEYSPWIQREMEERG